MVLLQPKLNLKVAQRQILTPGLVQMVSVLALNKLELKDMINAEIVENPVLEELDSTVPLIDDVTSKEEERQVGEEPEDPTAQAEKSDPFDEIDFGSFFQDYLDPGYRSHADIESIEKPSFENFLSRASTLTDHLMWQLGALVVREEVREAAELVIGNLDENGYLIASDEELLAAAHGGTNGVAAHAAAPALPVQVGTNGTKPPEALASDELASIDSVETDGGLGNSGDAAEHFGESPDFSEFGVQPDSGAPPVVQDFSAPAPDPQVAAETSLTATVTLVSEASPAVGPAPSEPAAQVTKGEPEAQTAAALFSVADFHEAIELIRQMDPVGVACRTLRECLMAQLKYHQQTHQGLKNGNAEATAQLLADCVAIADTHLHELQNKQYKEISKAIGRPLEAVMEAIEFIKTLDPRPGLRYNKVEPRLIEPDVAFVKQGDEYLVLMNEDDVPQLRLNPAYRKLLHREAAEKDVRNYVKERYKSAIQLIKNIEQRKQTILKTCYAIIGRQQEFLDKGIDHLKPMMIKEVAEEIGVHPSTVSRAVANKYAHTPQGVFELRYFFSESVNGPEGGSTSLLILKRRVKKLIDEEDPTRPLTDEQITRILQSQGIQVTRRTVAKYREDMRIPSTHQRRVKK